MPAGQAPVRLAIVGRPNVGKSTLFNRLTGRRLALVDDTPGVTRDWREAPGRIGDLDLIVIDTPGLEEARRDSLEARMRAQSERAVADADLVCLLIDARAGVMALDRHFAALMRKAKKPVILVANKAEARAAEAGVLDAFSLGLGEPVALSAEHGQGLGDLYDAIRTILPPSSGGEAEEAAPDAGEGAEDRALKLAVVGRPNVGKSTLINRLIGEERLLTGPEAGITRDAIDLAWTHKGRAIRLTDTAGMRRKARVEDKLEKLSVTDTLRAIRFAEIVILTIDANDMLEKQDLAIARLVMEEGRAMVIAANKWDAVADRHDARQRLDDRLQTSLPQARGVPIVTVSALTGKNLDALIDAAVGAYDVWNKRIGTTALNRWLADVGDSHPPPLASGRRNRLRYITQVKSRPPTFALFMSRPEELPDSYVRYLENELRGAFDLPGVPLRLMLRKGRNPYADKD